MVEAIKVFLNNPNTTGALLVTGKWGSGKTYFVKNTLSEANGIKDKYAFIVVSLFGASGIDDINSNVKKSYFSVKGTLINKNKKRKKDEGEGNSLLTGVANVLGEIEAPLGISKAIATTLKTNWKDFAPIQNKIDFKNANGDNEEREAVLVFDDLERYIASHPEEPVHHILGIINEYSENQGFKTIILADEEKIKDNKMYNEIKEKAIAQTLQFTSNHDEVYRIVIGKHEANINYHTFLSGLKRDATAVFQDTGRENIRSLINAIALFQIAFDKMFEKGIEHVDICGFFFNFLNMFFYSRNGMLSEGWIDNASLWVSELFLESGSATEESAGTEIKQQQLIELQLIVTRRTRV